MMSLALYGVCGCAELLSTHTIPPQYENLLFFAQVAVKLHSMNADTNIDGLQDLTDRYGVDMVTPTTDFFDSAERLIQAIKDLRQAIKSQTVGSADRSIDSATESAAILQAIQDSHDLSDVFDVANDAH